MTDVYWPRALCPLDFTIHPQATVKTGGRTMTGVEQIVASGAMFWRASFSFRVRSRDNILLWRAIQAKLRGRENVLRMGPFDFGRGPARIEGGSGLPTTVTHSDFATFDDLSEYEQSFTDARVSVVAAARDTTLTATVTGYTSAIQPGQFVSIDDRLYLLESVSTPSAGVRTLGIYPGLRSAAGVGTKIDFDRPLGRWRIASEDSGEMSLDMLKLSVVSINLVEALP